MKKRFIIYALIAFLAGFSITACGSNVTTTPAPIINTPDPEPAPDTYTLILYDSSGIGFSNGTGYNHFMDGHVTPISAGTFSVDDIIYEVDALGTVISKVQLPAIPSAVAVTASEIWTFETIPAVWAAANGGMYDEYTQIWQGYSEYIPWYNTRFEVTAAKSTASGDVIAYDILGIPITVTDAVTTHYAAQDGILIHTVDAVNRKGQVRTAAGDYPVAWSTNNFNSAKQWIEIAGAWYSWNGYRWNVVDGLTEGDTALADFVNWTLPVVISAGVRMDASLERGYWIEANTGWLWMYTPDMDTLEQVVRLYVADGERMTGINHAADMEPQILDGILYYSFEGAIWRYGFDSGINGMFVAGKKVRGM